MLVNNKISIITPIFNSGKFINNLCKNLIELTARLKECKIDVEIIFILDGCTDNSYELIKKNKNLLNIKVIELKENMGPSFCRNLGINNSSGEYLLFLDSDDTLEEYELPEIIASVKGHPDIIIGNYYVVEGSNQELKKHAIQSEKKNTNLSKEFVDNYLIKYCYEPYKYTLFVHCWCKLYGSNFIKANNIKFNEKIDQLEDVNFNLQCLKFEPRISYVNAPIYRYTKNSHIQNLSRLSGNKEKDIKDVVFALRLIKKCLEKMDYQELKKIRYHLYSTTFILWMIRSVRGSKNIFKNYLIISSYCSNKYVKLSMFFYENLKSNDHFLPFFVKNGMSLISLIYCKYFLVRKKL